MKTLITALALTIVTGSPAVAEPPRWRQLQYSPECPPERTIDALAAAVARVAPLFTKRAGPSGPATQGCKR